MGPKKPSAFVKRLGGKVVWVCADADIAAGHFFGLGLASFDQACSDTLTPEARLGVEMMNVKTSRGEMELNQPAQRGEANWCSVGFRNDEIDPWRFRKCVTKQFSCGQCRGIAMMGRKLVRHCHNAVYVR